MEALLLALFVINGIAHIFLYRKLKRTKEPNPTSALPFVLIYPIFGILIWQCIDWVKWPSLVIPILGLLALLFTSILKGKGQFIDYFIAILDTVIPILVLLYLFKF